MEELREFLLDEAKKVGLNNDWVDLCLDSLSVALDEQNLTKYLKFKCIQTPSSEQFSVELFQGLVFTKSPIDEKKMETELVRPNLLLWKGSLDMEKEDKDTTGQTFLFLEESVANVVLVENNISDEYRSYFLKHVKKITVVADMKHRLQRFPNLGFGCTSFAIPSNEIPDKKLMYFGGCGSLTIMLRGSNTMEVKVLKRLFKSCYNKLRNKLLSTRYYLVALPPLKMTAWTTDERQEVLVREEEISTFIAVALLQQTEDEPPESRPKPKFHVVCQHQDHFLQLRKNCNISEEQYIVSLCRCDKFDAKGGKSGAVFAKTMDGRFIIKEVKRSEYESFGRFGPIYFNYLNEAIETCKKTCIAKVFGMYQVEVTLGKRKFLMVMENLIFNRSLSSLYDLKGSVHGRLAPDATGVHLDQNLVNKMKRLPLLMSHSSEVNFEAAIRNDTEFLSAINVMDYSLLLGVDNKSEEVLCGIIDYLVPFSLAKRLESVAKSVVKKTPPTVIKPEDYKNRFVSFMRRLFLGETLLREKIKQLEEQLFKERKARLVAEETLEKQSEVPTQ